MTGTEHVDRLEDAIAALRDDLPRLDRWGRLIALELLSGHRLLAVGNGGSAAQAQHLTAELVGRYQHERRPLSAVALHADTSSVTAIANDYGVEEVFARQVTAHGRPGDVLVALSTSGHSPNVLAAVAAARQADLTVFALTGREPNPLAAVADHALVVDADTPTVQEIHQVAIHLICSAIDEQVHDHDMILRPRGAVMS